LKTRKSGVSDKSIRPKDEDDVQKVWL